MTLLPEEMDGSYTAVQNTDGSFTVTTDTNQQFRMTEESFDEFISKMGLTIQDLDGYRSQVLGGSVIRLREGMNPEYISAGSFRTVDTVNVPFGTFDDAVELAEAYKGTFYPSRAEQLDRVFHGLDTGRVVSEDIKVSYLESDGNVSADVVSIGSEFDTRGSVSENEVTEVQEENSEEEPPASDAETPGSDTGATGSESETPGSEDEPRTTL
ncbi:hypothetical protein SAMN05216270_12111 [Glycomyces harbinensis]|uniref:Uncharacterized protein n=1 Tax=Glycomyces harbinensis TaxID=58114 RepID=A0A1G7CT42_9ACTN|nr:hypothetical protein SAMN05216270_12111 [Glycomyces harbinensis]